MRFKYESWRYGFFVHYIACAAHSRDGADPQTVDEAADAFDVPGFVDDIRAMGVEYVIFTAWHFRVMPLYPSRVNDAVRPGCSPRRDLLGEIIDGLKGAGIGVILYTHPRDGHDFVGAERVDCGWGEGYRVDGGGHHKDTPNPATFQYEKWNSYMQALYQELLDRYGDRIDGIFTDGTGPMRLASNWPYYYDEPVVDYLAIRRKIKARENLVMIQNGFGCEFSDDYVMPEGYFSYEVSHPDVWRWPACEKAMAMQPFSGWAASGKYPENHTWMTGEDIARFTLFQASCALGGGMTWAAGPYAGGGWDAGVMENMLEVGRHMKRLELGWRDCVQSPSWPTVSGDTLFSRSGVFASTARRRDFEYIHIMKMPEDGVVHLPAPQDGARFSTPVALSGDVVVTDMRQTDDGVTLTLEGSPDPIDTIIRLSRKNDPAAPVWFWFNDTDKRIRYTDIQQWRYHCLGEGYNTTDATHRMLGCFEYDSRTSLTAGARFDTWFEGSEVELYGCMDPSGARADFLVDDMLVAVIDTRAPQRQVRVRLAASGELGGGVHTVSIIAHGPGFEFEALRMRK